MALSRSNEFDTGTILTETKLEGEFDNIYNNALSLISPLTGTLDANSQTIDNIGTAVVETAIQIQAASSQIVFDSDGAATGTLTWTPASSSKTLTLPNATDTLVGKATTDTLTNKTLTAPVIATIVNTGTLTLPSSTDTLVGRDTTDTLTNKTITAPVLSGSATGTYTLAGTPTITSPTLGGTVAGQPTWASIQTIPAVTTSTAIGAGTPVASTLYKENIPKGFILIDGDATPAVSLGDFNVSGFADTATGRYTITWDVDFADVTYAVLVTPGDASSPIGNFVSVGRTAGAVEVQARDAAGNLADATEVSVLAIGAQ
jgi:hypothetical protein